MTHHHHGGLDGSTLINALLKQGPITDQTSAFMRP
jgi:hypothetical protein